MALLSPLPVKHLSKVTIELDDQLINGIKHYCKYANLSGIDEFVEQAANFVFSKDKEWIKIGKKNVKK